MGEKTDELYQKYLNNQLDLVFNRDKSIPVFVYINGKYNYETADGSYLSDIWFDDAWQYKDGFACVSYDGKEYHIDIHGNPVGNVKYEEVFNFVNGIARVKLYDDMYSFIDTKGKLIRKVWYKYAKDFSEDGLALVEVDGKFNYVNTKGDLLLSKGYDSGSTFKNGYAAVERKYFFTFIDTSGKQINPTCWYLRVDDFTKDGIARVEDNHGYYYIDTKGNQINDEPYLHATEFIDNRAVVKRKNGKNGIIDEKNNLISGKWYDFVKLFSNGYAYVTNGSKYNFMDIKTGHFLDKWKHAGGLTAEGGKNYLKKYNSFARNSFIFLTKDFGGYQVDKVLKGYRFKKDNESFIVPCKPLKIYGNRYVLCGYYHDFSYRIKLYDNKTKETWDFGPIDDLEYDDNFITINKDGKVECKILMYNNEILDITDYYKKYIKVNAEIHITPGIEILSKNDFFIKHEEDIKSDYNKDKKNREALQNEEAQKKENRELLSTKEKNEISDKEKEEEWNKAVENLKKSIVILEQLEKEKGLYLRIKVSNLLINVGDHKEINPFYINEIGLKHIDLSGENFKNVKLSGIDFRGCNIQFNPQDIYPINCPDLRDCNFEGIHIPTFTNFIGVDIRGAKFSSGNNTRIVDFMNSFLSGAIYDETTTYNSVPLTDLINKEEKKNNQSTI